MDFKSWRNHIDAVVDSEGQWIGLCDENGAPLIDLGSYLSVSAPAPRLTAGALELSLNAGPGNPVVDELIAGGVGVQDESGALEPAKGPTRMVVIQRAGKARLAYFVTHGVLGGVQAPSRLAVHGVGAVDCLAFWPGPSIPLEWVNAAFKEMGTDASGAEYSRPRRLALVPFATIADGHTIRGRARTVIRDFIQDSFDAVNSLMGWVGDEHAVVDYGGPADDAAELLLRTGDDYVLDTISAPAKNHGLSVTVDLWWPGDSGVLVRTARDPVVTSVKTWARPMLVVRVDKMREV